MKTTKRTELCIKAAFLDSYLKFFESQFQTFLNDYRFGD